ncbi:MAG: ATP-binding protein [candidate division KSB1 bacterium]|nr:ATP-binding protein [candidate division KSB1 bacterium]MDZ7368632.1 ATP-binding protein [candidate division KSB1 bacterium]MDZ7406332.1 ATP-binding protein [candidate division KSB1 bacterium]
MRIFFLWFAATLILLAGYLSLLWWRPRFLFKKDKPAAVKSGRFQARLTIFFLLFALLPSVPLVFLVSALYTRSMEILLVPKIQESLLQGLDAIKFQLEERGRLFEQATRNMTLSPELLQQWQIAFCLLWQRDGENVQLASAVGADLASRQRGLDFGIDQIIEVWGQTGSQLRPAFAGDTTRANYCYVWLPRVSNTPFSNGAPSPLTEMLVAGFQVPPYVLEAKQNLTEAARVYNTLALMKERLLRDEILWSAAALAIMLLAAVSVYAARRFSQTLSRPLERLTATMGEVAGGNLQVRADIQARDEIGVLVDSFNRMIDDLRVSREKLVASERLAAWREVARQVSHEIKNPLTALQLALYRLRQHFAADDQEESSVKESFQSLDDELAGLRHLAEEFSDFARLPKAERVMDNLNDVVKLTAHLHEAGWPERIQIQLELDPDLPPRPIDREQIKRLLNNLLKNALEATPNRRCEVRMTTRRLDERAVLEIADNGPGLSAEARQKLFQMNFTTKREGSGLGLVMVKRIVEEHDGTIEAESEAGKGTRFRIVI